MLYHFISVSYMDHHAVVNMHFFLTPAFFFLVSQLLLISFNCFRVIFGIFALINSAVNFLCSGGGSTTVAAVHDGFVLQKVIPFPMHSLLLQQDYRPSKKSLKLLLHDNCDKYHHTFSQIFGYSYFSFLLFCEQALLVVYGCRLYLVD